MYYNSPTESAEFKIFPGENTPNPRSRGEESFRSPKMYQNSPTAMLDSNISPGTIPRTFVLGERKICFCSPKTHHNSPIQQCRIQKFSGVNIPDLHFRGGSGWGNLFSFSENVPKLSYSNAKIQKFSLGQYSRPSF